MSRVVALNHVTVDGVMHAPGLPGEVPPGGSEQPASEALSQSTKYLALIQSLMSAGLIDEFALMIHPPAQQVRHEPVTIHPAPRAPRR